MISEILYQIAVDKVSNLETIDKNRILSEDEFWRLGYYKCVVAKQGIYLTFQGDYSKYLKVKKKLKKKLKKNK